jgi:hypothetical protein
MISSSLYKILTGFCRSVHNVRIERLWVDITAQVGATWSEYFTNLELRHGLDINNVNHIWLLHHIFLPTINAELAFFAESWNQHRIQIRDGPNRSPADMFGFDMIVHGVRGFQLPEENMSDEELEVYGVDWEGLHDERLLESQRRNNQVDEGWSSWVGNLGPPDNLNEVLLESVDAPLLPQEVNSLDQYLSPWANSVEYADIVSAWSYGLAFTRRLYGNLF